jgi:hypothetical protein
MPRFNTRTDLDMVNSGAWNKVGKKHFRHVSGAEVRYDCNAWTWAVTGCAADGERYSALHAARSRVEYVTR